MDAPTQNTPPTQSFLRGAFSDGGEPSSSRVISAFLAIAVTGILIGVFWHVCRTADIAALGQWLGALPGVIGALIALMAAPYGINKGSTTISQAIDSIMHRDH
jgi:hypothetical protein